MKLRYQYIVDKGGFQRNTVENKIQRIFVDIIFIVRIIAFETRIKH